jgi:hypothetical protein
MSVKVIYGEVYPLLVAWLSGQRRPFLVVPNIPAARVLEDRLVFGGREDLARHLESGRVGRLAAELIGPGEDVSTIDLVIEREILRGLLPAEYKQFGAHDAFMDQVIRELDDLRRNCSGETAASAEAALSGASLSPRERDAFESTLRLRAREPLRGKIFGSIPSEKPFTGDKLVQCGSEEES